MQLTCIFVIFNAGQLGEKVTGHRRMGNQLALVELVRCPLHDVAVHSVLGRQHSNTRLTVLLPVQNPLHQRDAQALAFGFRRQDGRRQLEVIAGQ